LSVQVQQLPLFPLDVVLFPGMMLPLHIFEERYKTMVQRCVRRGTPFGVVLTRGVVDGREVPYDVGTMATISDAQRLVGGRYNITTVGVQRFLIRSILYGAEPYLIGQVEPLEPLDAESGEAHVLSAQLCPLLDRYVELLGTVIDRTFTISPYPDDPMTRAFLAAILLQVPNSEKQELLAAQRVPDLLRLELALLDHENMIMKFMAGYREHLPHLVEATSGVFSTN